MVGYLAFCDSINFYSLLFVPVSCMNLSFFTWWEKTQHNGFEYLSKLDQEGGGFNFFASGASLSLSIFPTVTIYLFRVASAQCSESVHFRCRARCPDISQWAPDSQVIAPTQSIPPPTLQLTSDSCFGGGENLQDFWICENPIFSIIISQNIFRSFENKSLSVSEMHSR